MHAFSLNPKVLALLFIAIQISDSYISSGKDFAVRTRGNACSLHLTGAPVTLSAPFTPFSRARISQPKSRIHSGYLSGSPVFSRPSCRASPSHARGQTTPGHRPFIQLYDGYRSSGADFPLRTRGNPCSHLLTGPPVTLSAPRGLSKARPSIGFPRLITGFWRFTGSILPSGYESPAPIPSSQPQLLFLVSGSQLSALSSVASHP